MAKKIKETVKAAASGGIPAEELKRVVKEHQRQTSQASEYNGRAGQAIKTAIDRHNLNQKAFRSALGNDKMEETKRQDYLRSFLEYSFKLGHFDAVDAFDDVLTYMQNIIDETRARADGPRKADSVVSAVLQ